jgi:type II secretory pathway component PulM
MSARERRLVIGGAIAMVLFLAGGVVWFAWAQVQSLEQEVIAKQATLKDVQELASKYESNIEKAAKIKKILEDNRNTTMQSFVEKKAAEVGIQRDRLDAIRDKPGTLKGDLEEKAFTVQVSKLSLEDAMNFIHTLETSSYPMVIRSAKFKTTKISGEKVIRLTLEIAAFRLATASTGGE